MTTDDRFYIPFALMVISLVILLLTLWTTRIPVQIQRIAQITYGVSLFHVLNNLK